MEDLTKEEYMLLEKIYIILGEPPEKSSEVGYDEIEDITSYKYQEIKEACKQLEDKGYLQIDETDIYFIQRNYEKFKTLEKKYKK